MTSRGMIRSLALAVRREPVWHITAPHWLATLLVAGGARRASSDAAEMSAFDEFFRHHYPAMVRLVMYTGATLHDAEDAVSTAMVEAYLAWPLLVNPTAWVRTAAIHNFVNDAKRNRRRPALEAQAARRDRTDTPTERVEEPDERDLILAALHELPPAQQRVMALLMDGHRPTEIAEMLGVNPHNVRSNLRHARDRMQARLATA